MSWLLFCVLSQNIKDYKRAIHFCGAFNLPLCNRLRGVRFTGNATHRIPRDQEFLVRRNHECQ